MDKPFSKLDRPNSYIGRSVTRTNAKRLLAGKLQAAETAIAQCQP